MNRRLVVTLGGFYLWTLFVWGLVRVRNIIGDDALTSSQRYWALTLSLSIALPTLVIGAYFLSAVLRGRDMSRPAVVATTVLVGWTIAVWLERVIAMALFGTHAVAFVAVHTVLAIISIGLGIAALTAIRRSWVSPWGMASARPVADRG